MFAGDGYANRVAAIFGSVFIERKGADEAGFAGKFIRRFDRRLGGEAAFKKLNYYFRLTAAGFHAIAGQRLFETLGNANGGGHGLALK